MAIAKFTVEMAAELGQLRRDFTEMTNTIKLMGAQVSSLMRSQTMAVDATSKSYVGLMNAAKEARRQIEFTVPSGQFSELVKGQRDTFLKGLADQKILRQEQYKNIQLAYQLQDFGVQVMGGQNPLVALVQQGSQLAGIYGGVGNAVKAVAAAFTPLRIAAGGVLSVVGALGMAFVQGSDQSAKFKQSLLLTGNIAGQTADSFERLVQSVSKSGDLGAGKVRDMAQAIISSGRFTGQGLDDLTRTAMNMALATGQTVDQVVQSLSQMADAPAAWATQQNKTYHFLTASQIDYIRALEANGRKEDAVFEVRKALGEKFVDDVKKNFGILKRMSHEVGKMFDTMWDKIEGIGRGLTIDEEIQHAIEQLERAKKRQPPDQKGDALNNLGRLSNGVQFGLGRDPNPLEYDPIGLASRIRQLQMKQGAEKRLADWASRQAATEQAQIEKNAHEEKLRPARDNLLILQSQIKAKTAIFALDAQIKKIEIDRALGGQNVQTEMWRDEQTAKYEILKIDQQLLDIDRQIRIASASRAAAFSDGLPKDPVADLAAQARIEEMQSRRAEMVAGKTKVELDLTAKMASASIKLAEIEDAKLVKQEDSYQIYGEQLRVISAIRREHEIEFENIGKSAEVVQRIAFLRNISRISTEAELQADEDKNKGLIDEAEHRRRITGITVEQTRALGAYARVFDDMQAKTYLADRGVVEAIREWRIEAAKSGDLSKSAALTVVSSWEDATLNMLKMGKLNTTMLVDSMITEFMRLKVVKPFIGGLLDAGGSTVLMRIFGGNPAENPYSKDAVNGSDKGWLPYAANHDGGIAGAEASMLRLVSPTIFQNAKKFHTGGLAYDEVPIVAKRGEGIFTSGQMRALGLMANAGQASVKLNQNVQIINKTDSRVSTNVTSTGDLVVSIEGALADRVANGQGALARSIESRYNAKTAVF